MHLLINLLSNRPQEMEIVSCLKLPIMSMDGFGSWAPFQGLFPLFCVEVYLMDGTSFHLHSILQREDTNNSLIMRVWDFRAFTPEDIEELKENLYSVAIRKDLDNPQEIHPKLDWGDVRLHLRKLSTRSSGTTVSCQGKYAKE